MTRPNPEQLSDYEQQTRWSSETDLRFAREGFIRDFLEFAGKVAYGTSGGGSGRMRGLMYYENYGQSKAVPIATREGSPQMGATISGYFTELRRGKRFGRGERTIIREVSGAAIYIGALATTQWGTNIHGGTRVLQVFNNPRLAFYRPNDAEQLTLMENDTPEWDEAINLVEQLKAQEKAMANGDAQPIGWLS